MRAALVCCIAVCLAAHSSAPAPAPSRLAAPHALQVESLAAPEGLDAPSPRFSWLLSAQPGARALAQYAYELQLAFGATNFTTSQVVSNATSLVSPPGLPPLPPSSRITWRVRAWEAAGAAPSPLSAPASFTTGLAAWGGEWVCGARGTENAFRAAFALPPGGSPVALALAHVAGLGEHSVTLNGAPPPSGAQQQQRKLDGGWTSFKKRVLYTTHDLTGGLLAGENVLGVELGSSWFNARGWYAQPPYGWPSAANGGGFSYRAPPLLRVQLVLTLQNGTVLRQATSGGGGAAAWQWLAADSPTTFDSLYDGETRDGRRAAALAGWDAPGFAPAAGDWLPVASASNASLNPAAGAALAAQAYEPVVRLTAATPATMWQPAPGTTVYDCGSNGVGVVRWTFRGLPAGSNVTLRYAEVLQHPPYGPADGSLYFDNLRNARATDYYAADGSGGEEVFEPLHTWHGFRYAQFSVQGGGGGVAPPALTDVQCIRQGNAVAPGASAAFSLPVLGAIQQLATNTMVGSFQHGPGSCGNRDERQFFTGDTQVTAQASMQYFRLRALMAAWLQNGLTDQNEDGSIGFYLPTPIGDARTGSPQWSTGFLTVAWLLLRLEGDFASVAAAYPAIQRYLAFNERMYAQSVAKCGGLACYWPAWPSEWQQLGPSPNASCMNSMACASGERARQRARPCSAARSPLSPPPTHTHSRARAQTFATRRWGQTLRSGWGRRQKLPRSARARARAWPSFTPPFTAPPAAPTARARSQRTPWRCGWARRPRPARLPRPLPPCLPPLRPRASSSRLALWARATCTRCWWRAGAQTWRCASCRTPPSPPLASWRAWAPTPPTPSPLTRFGKFGTRTRATPSWPPATTSCLPPTRARC